jgi:hypothetical protein
LPAECITSQNSKRRFRAQRLSLRDAPAGRVATRQGTLARTDLSFKALRVWLSKPFVLSFETVIRPATLPKLDNGVEFQVVSMVNRLRQFASREELYCALLFSL